MTNVDRYGLESVFSFEEKGNPVAAMERVEKGLKGIENAVKGVSQAVQTSHIGQSIKQSFGGATGAIGHTKQQLGGVQGAVKAVQTGLTPLKQEFRALRAESRNIDFGDLTDKRQFQHAKTAVEQYISELKHLQDQVTGNTTTERQFRAELERASKIAQNKLDVSEQQRSGAVAAQRAGTAAAVVGAGTAISAPLIGLGASSLQTYSGFEDQLLAVKAVTAPAERTEQNLERIRMKSKLLGASTKFSAADAAGGFVLLAQAGYSVEQQLSAIDGTLNLAAAGGVDLTESTNITIEALAQFKKQASEAGTVADILAYSSSAANLGVRDIGEALKYAGSPAQSFGATIQETTAMIASLADVGIKGGQAGTSMRSIFLSLAKPTGEAANMLNTLGVSIADSEGKVRPVLDVFRELTDSFSSMEGAERLSAIKTIFGTESTTSALRLFSKDGFQSVTKYNRGITSESAGAATQQANIRESGIGGSFRTLQSALEGVRIEIAEQLEPIIKRAVDTIAGLAQAFIRLPAPVKQIIVLVGGITAGLATVAIVAGSAALAFFTLQQAIATTQMAQVMLSQGFIPLTGVMQKTTLAFGTQGFAGALGSLGSGFTALGTSITTFATGALATLTSPIALTIGAGMALIAVLEILTPGFNVLGTVIGVALAPAAFAFGVIKGLLEGIWTAFKPVINQFSRLGQTGGYLGEVFKRISKILSDSSGAGEALGKVLGFLVSAAIATPLRALIGVFQVLFSTLHGIGVVAGAIASPFIWAVRWITGAWQGFIDWFLKMPLVSFAMNLGQGLINALNHSPTIKIPLAWEKAIGWIGGLFNDFMGFAKTTAEFVLGVLNPANWIAGVGSVFESMAGYLSLVLTAPIQLISLVGSGVIEFLTGQWQGFTTWLTDKLLAIPNAVKNSLSSIVPPFLRKEQEQPQLPDLEPVKYPTMQLSSELAIQPFNLPKLPELPQLPGLENAVNNIQPFTRKPEPPKTPIAVASTPTPPPPPPTAPVIQPAPVVSAPAPAPVVLPVQVEVQLDKVETALAPVVASLQTQIPQVREVLVSGFEFIQASWNERAQQLQMVSLGELIQIDFSGIKQEFNQLISATADFGREMGSAILRLDFNAAKDSLLSYGSKFAETATGIGKRLGNMTLSAIVFGVTSLGAFSPMLLVLGGIALAVLAISTNFLGLRTILSGVAKVASGLVHGLFQGIKGLIQIAKGVIQIFSGVSAAIRGDFSVMAGGIELVFTGIRNIAHGIAHGLVEIFRGAVLALHGVFQGLEQIVRGVFGTIGLIFRAPAASFEFLATTGRSTAQFLSTAFHGTAEFISTAFQQLSQNVSSRIESISDVGRSVAQFLSTAFHQLSQGISGAFEFIANAGRSAFNQLGTAGEVVSKFLANMLDAPRQAWQALISMIDQAISKLKSVTSAITSIPGKATEAVKSKFGFGKKPAPTPEVVTEVAAPAQVQTSVALAPIAPQPVIQPAQYSAPKFTPAPVPASVPVSTPTPLAPAPSASALSLQPTIAPVSVLQTPTPQITPQVPTPQIPVQTTPAKNNQKNNQSIIPLPQNTISLPEINLPGIEQPEIKPTVHTQQATQQLSRLEREVNETHIRLSQSANQAIGSVGVALSGIAPGLAAPLMSASDLLSGFDSLREVAPNLKSSLEGIWGSLRNTNPGEVFNTLKASAQSSLTVVRGVAGNLGGMLANLEASFGTVVAGILSGNITLAGSFAGVRVAAASAWTSMIAPALPILGIIAAIGAGVGLLYLAWRSNFLGISSLVHGVIRAISGVVHVVGSLIKFSVLAVGYLLKFAIAFSPIGLALFVLVNAVKLAGFVLVGTLKGVWNVLASLVKGFLSPFQPLIQGFIAIGRAVGGFLGGAFSRINQFANLLLGVGKSGQSVSGSVKGIADALTAPLRVLSSIAFSVGQLLNPFTIILVLVKGFAAGIAAVGRLIETVILAPFRLVAGTVQTVGNLLGKKSPSVAQPVQPVQSVQPGQIAQPLADSTDQVQSSWNGFAGWFGNTMGSMVGSAKDAGMGMIDALNHNPTIIIPRSWQGAVTQIHGFLSGLIPGAIGVGRALVERLTLNPKIQPELALDNVSQVSSTARDAITNTLTFAVETTSKLTQQLQGVALVSALVGGTSLLSLSPLLAIMGGIALAVVAVASNLLGIRTILTGIIQVISGLLTVLKGISEIAGATLSGILRLGQGITQVLSGIPAALRGDFSQIQIGLETISQAFSGFGAGLRQGFSTIGTGMRQIFEGAGTIIKGILEGINQLFSGLAQAAKLAFQGIETAINGAVMVLRSLENGLNALPGMSAAITQKMQSAWSGLVNWLGTVKLSMDWSQIANLPARIGAIGQELQERVKQFIFTLPEMRLGGLLNLGEQVQGIARSATDGMIQAWKIGIEVLPNLFSAAIEKIQALWSGMTEKVGGFVDRLTGRTKQQGKQLQANLAEASPGPTFQIRTKWAFTTERIEENLSILRQKTQVTGQQIGQHLSRGLEQAGTHAKGAVHHIGDRAKQVKQSRFSSEGMNTLNRSVSSVAMVVNNVNPALAAPLFMVNDLIDAAGSLGESLPQAQKFFTGLLPSVKLFGTQMSGQALKGLPLMRSAIVSILPAFVSLGGVAMSAGAAVGAALLPVLPIVAAIAGGAALLYLAWQSNFLGLRSIILGVIDIINRLFQVVTYLLNPFKWLADLASLVAGSLSGASEAIKGAWSGFGEWFSGAMGNMVGNAQDTGQGLINALNHSPTIKIPIAWQGAIGSISGGFDWLVGKAGAIGTGLVNVFAGATGVISKAFSQVFGQLTKTVVLFGLSSAVSFAPFILALAGVGLVMFLISQNFLGLKTMITGALQIIQALLQMVGQVAIGVVQVLTGFAQVIGGLLTGNLSQVRAGITQVFSGIQGIASAVATGIQSAFTGAVTVLQGLFQGVGQVFGAVLIQPKQVWEGFLNLLKQVGDKITQVTQTISSAVSASAPGKFIKSIGMKMQGKTETVNQAQELIDFDERLAQVPAPSPNTPPPNTIAGALQQRQALKTEAQAQIARATELDKARETGALSPQKLAVQQQQLQQKSAEIGQQIQVSSGAIRNASVAAFSDATNAASSLSTVIGVIAPGLAAPIAGFAALASGILGLITTLPTLIASFAGLGSVFGVISGIATGMWAAITGPLLPFIVAIGAAVGVVLLLKTAFENNWLGVRDVITNLWNSISGFFSGFVSGITQGINQLINFGMQVAKIAFFISPIGIALRFVSGLIRGLGAGIAQVIGFVQAEFGNLIGSVIGAMQSIWQSVGVVFGAFTQMVGVIFQAFSPLKSGKDELSGIQVIVGLLLIPLRVVAVVLAVIFRAIALIVNIIAAVLNPVIQTLAIPFKVIAGIVQGVMFVIGAIANAVSSVISGIVGMIGKVFQFIYNLIPAPIRFVIETTGKAIGAVVNFLTGMSSAPQAGANSNSSQPAVQKFATGGWVRGSGIDDRITALVKPDEFVMNPVSARLFAPVLEAMNLGGESGMKALMNFIPTPPPMFAPQMVPVPAATGGNSSDRPVQVNLSIENLNIGQNGGSPQSARALAMEMLEILEPQLARKVIEMLRDATEKAR